jgi:hypothetical protein
MSKPLLYKSMSTDYNENDKIKIIQDRLQLVEQKLNQQDFLDKYILETLNSFAYRYFDAPKIALQLTPHVFMAMATELGIKEAIKLKSPELRAGIRDLVKRVNKAQGPTIVREIRVNIIERDSRHSGECKLSARISFGHPEHDFSQGTYVEKMSLMTFSDDLQFRNTLALHLEEVCELF